MSETKNHVRLKPYNPPAGQTKRQYNSPWGVTYKSGIWYVEKPEVAVARGTYLAAKHMNSSDNYSPKAFNVCTREEAEQIKLYEESGELEQVLAASNIVIPPAPTGGGAAEMSQDLNLPSPKSELAAAAAAAAAEAEAARSATPPPPAAKAKGKSKTTGKAGAKKTKAGKTRARRRNPGAS